MVAEIGSSRFLLSGILLLSGTVVQGLTSRTRVGHARKSPRLNMLIAEKDRFTTCPLSAVVFASSLYFLVPELSVVMVVRVGNSFIFILVGGIMIVCSYIKQNL